MIFKYACFIFFLTINYSFQNIWINSKKKRGRGEGSYKPDICSGTKKWEDAGLEWAMTKKQVELQLEIHLNSAKMNAIIRIIA